jgi:protein-L-isoaspartate(D-aspartate) O-methyltransferase
MTPGRPHTGYGMTSQRTRARMIERLREQGIVDEEVLAAIAAVPRHVFVEEALASRAYEDDLGKTLEIGAGCGYQAAVLAQLTDEVYAVERIAPLLAKAKLNLRAIKQLKVRLKHADGQFGLPEAAPFDTIIVAAAAAHVPRALMQQLAPNGRMILPLGTATQQLVLIDRRAEAYVETRLDAVRFVPLLSGVE